MTSPRVGPEAKTRALYRAYPTLNPATTVQVCTVVKGNGDMCGRDLPCRYHTPKPVLVPAVDELLAQPEVDTLGSGFDSSTLNPEPPEPETGATELIGAATGAVLAGVVVALGDVGTLDAGLPEPDLPPAP